MKCIRHINYPKNNYSLKIDIKDINDIVFEKYLKWFFSDPHGSVVTLTVSPSYVVSGPMLHIDKYISPGEIIEDIGTIYYTAISILDKELEKLVKHWLKNDSYEVKLVTLFTNTQKLIDEANIKNIIE